MIEAQRSRQGGRDRGWICDHALIVIPASSRNAAAAAMQAYCIDHVPDHVRVQINLGHTIEGNAITLVEHRPHWRDPTAPWTAMNIARIRWNAATSTWSLDWSDSHGRWIELEPVRPVAELQLALQIIDENPNGCFWG